MACTVVTLPTGGRAIVCGARRAKPHCGCGAPAGLLCDWKVGPGKATCDKPICAACSVSPAPGKDLCLIHAADWEAWRANRATRT
jgi:hypothetical protein